MAKTEAVSPTKTPPGGSGQKKRGRPPGSGLLKIPKESSTKSPKENVSDSLDSTVDEFSRAVQEEEQAEKNVSAIDQSPATSAIAKSLVTTISSTAKSPSATKLTLKSLMPKQQQQQQLKAVVKTSKDESKSESAAQMQIVNEILRKNPG